MKDYKDLMEEMKSVVTESNDKKYAQFTKQLEKLSKKYGVAIQAIGGVSIGEIKSINYDSDLESGDLNVKVVWKEE